MNNIFRLKPVRGYTLIELLLVSTILVIIVASTGMLVSATGKLVVTRKTSQAVISQLQTIAESIKNDIEDPTATTVQTYNSFYRSDWLLIRNAQYTRLYCWDDSYPGASFRSIFRLTNPDLTANFSWSPAATRKCNDGTMLISGDPTKVTQTTRLTNSQMSITRLVFQGYYHSGISLQITGSAVAKNARADSLELDTLIYQHYNLTAFSPYVQYYVP